MLHPSRTRPLPWCSLRVPHGQVVSYFTGLVPPREQGTDQGTEQQLDWGADTLAAIQLEGTMADSQIVLPESSQSLK